MEVEFEDIIKSTSEVLLVSSEENYNVYLLDPKTLGKAL